jgi:hypothetical protein
VLGYVGVVRFEIGDRKGNKEIEQMKQGNKENRKRKRKAVGK